METESEKFVLAPYVKVVVGGENSIIYDFKHGEAYQITETAGKFLNVVFSQKNFGEANPTKWRRKIEERFSTQNLRHLDKFLKKLKEFDILIYSNEYSIKDTFESELETNVSSKSPSYCSLELTSRCNFSCPHCYLGAKSSPHDLDFESICKILGQIKRMGIKKVHLTGGEVFVREDIEEIIRTTYNHGFDIEISTNGSLVSPSLLKRIKEYVTRFRVTVYGLTPDIYRLISDSSGAFNRVFSFINELKKQNSSEVKLNFTIAPFNYQEHDRFLQFVEDRDFEHKVGKTLPIGLASGNMDMLKPGYRSFIEELEGEKIDEEGIGFRLQACDSEQICVLSSGKITPCLLLRKPEFILGDICQDTLKTVWHERALPFLNSLHVDKMDVCDSCEYKYLCGGGCPALWQGDKTESSQCRVPTRIDFTKGEFTRKYILKSCKL